LAAHVGGIGTNLTHLVEFFCDTIAKPNGWPRRKLDVIRTNALFSFDTTTLFKTGLLRTNEWYKKTR